MSPSEAISIFQNALLLALLLASPMLAFGLVAGLVVSVFQAVTQIQELTLSFVPKIFAIVASLFIFLPWMLNKIMHYTIELFGSAASIR